MNCTPYHLRFRAVFKHPASRPAELFLAPPVFKRRSRRLPQHLAVSTEAGCAALCSAPEEDRPPPRPIAFAANPVAALANRRIDRSGLHRKAANTIRSVRPIRQGFPGHSRSPPTAPDCHRTVRRIALRHPPRLPLVGVGGLLTKGRQATLSSPSQGAPEAKARGAPTPNATSRRTSRPRRTMPRTRNPPDAFSEQRHTRILPNPLRGPVLHSGRERCRPSLHTPVDPRGAGRGQPLDHRGQ